MEMHNIRIVTDITEGVIGNKFELVGSTMCSTGGSTYTLISDAKEVVVVNFEQLMVLLMDRKVRNHRVDDDKAYESSENLPHKDKQHWNLDDNDNIECSINKKGNDTLDAKEVKQSVVNIERNGYQGIPKGNGKTVHGCFPIYIGDTNEYVYVQNNIVKRCKLNCNFLFGEYESPAIFVSLKDKSVFIMNNFMCKQSDSNKHIDCKVLSNMLYKFFYEIKSDTKECKANKFMSMYDIDELYFGDGKNEPYVLKYKVGKDMNDAVASALSLSDILGCGELEIIYDSILN